MTTKTKARRTAADDVREIAAVLGANGKPDAPIRVAVTRETLMRRGIKPEKRGGALTVGQHAVLCDGAGGAA